MLKFEGFKSAELFSRNPEDEGQPKDDEHFYFTVQYKLASRAALDDYIKNHSPKMRQEGLDRFGTKFSATRRILNKM
jgi:hypothetical protein